MKRLKFLMATATLFVFAGVGKSDTLSPEAVRIGILAVDLSVYESAHSGAPANKWQDVAGFFGDLQRIDVELENGKRFTEIYSLVPVEEGKKFPDGTLICVRYEPAAWPAEWSDDPKKKEKDAGDLNREKPIRYLIYKNPRGDILSTWWYEEKIQAMLAQTGLTIPPPKPYYPPPPTPAGAKPSDTTTVNAPTVATNAAPQAKPVEIPSLPPAPPQPTKQPSNPAWWIIGLIILAAGVVFVARKKKPKA